MRNEKIKLFIQKLTHDVMNNNSFFREAETGSLSEKQIQLYLYNLKAAFSQTPHHLAQAALTARELKQEDFANYLESKIEEELGHDQWAENDLKKFKTVSDHEVTEATRAVINYADRMSNLNPIGYLCYMTFTEYFTVLAAPSLIANIQAKCGVPSTHMSAITNHQEADADHVDEDLASFEKFVPESLGFDQIQKYLADASGVINAALESYSGAPSI